MHTEFGESRVAAKLSQKITTIPRVLETCSSFLLFHSKQNEYAIKREQPGIWGHISMHYWLCDDGAVLLVKNQRTSSRTTFLLCLNTWKSSLAGGRFCIFLVRPLTPHLSVLRMIFHNMYLALVSICGTKGLWWHNFLVIPGFVMTIKHSLSIDHSSQLILHAWAAQNGRGS